MKKIIVLLIVLMCSINFAYAEEVNCTTTLTKGTKGENVKILQTNLNKITSCNLAVDGIYGNLTKACVSKFQKSNNIAETGIVNKTTCNAINKQEKSVEETTEATLCDETLKKGSRGANVKILQTKLNSVTSCNLKVDGIYGNLTKACVSKFQEANNITKTGTVNKTTCKAINEVKETTKESFCSNTLKVGSKGEDVKTLQTKLNKVMNCSLSADGKYGNLTKACVMKYQMNLGLDVTGVVDGTTCNKLVNQETSVKKEEKLQVKSKSIIVVEDDVELQKERSIDSKVLKTVSFGEIYQYDTTYRTNGITWYKVKIDDSYGYIQSKYVSKNFIVVDKSQQKLILYKNEKVILNTEVVTGMYENHDTPTGYYKLEKKNLVRSKTLRGYNDDGSKYASYVDYWMPFIMSRGIGFHDADWRTKEEFTEYRYLYDGSHGCINMKKEAAKTLFTNITEDIDVIIRN